MCALMDIRNEKDERSLTIDRVGVKVPDLPVEVRDKTGQAWRSIVNAALAVGLPQCCKGVTHMIRIVGISDVRRAQVALQFPSFRSQSIPVTGKEGLGDYEVRLEAGTGNFESMHNHNACAAIERGNN